MPVSFKKIQVPPEDSLALRISAQALVLVGIMATDTAADTTIGLWAIPASLAGASWSWVRRDQRNIATKFLLAIGMIIALIVFFGSLLGGRELNDTRLALAGLLVQVQVLHSFDLPRRKDLGYSMVIGLILLGVACTLSQTMVFGLWVLLFLAIALPVLVMDYRARLGLSRWPAKLPKASGSGRKASWTALPLMFGIVLSLGLLIFALMPRLPGYQIRSFPMSAPIESSQKFDNQRVTNPGYVRGGSPNGVKAGRGRSPETGAGEVDSSVYYGFGTKINQNLRGKMSETVVMRVRSQAEGFWRVMAFDRYTGQGWEASRNDKTETLTRQPWSYQFYPPQKVRLNRVKQVVQTYTMVSELPNVIPALDQPKEVFFPTQELAIDHEGGLRSPVALTEGLTYTVISEVPYRDLRRLQQAQSQFPSRASLPNPYSEIADRTRPRVKELAETLLKQANSPITSDYGKALYLAQALKQRYTVQMDLPFLDPKEDLVEAFLFRYNGGYPDHFSTVLTVMLRSLGMSTRLATGFGPGQFNPFTGYYVVKNTDAYAVTELYLHKFGWFMFDPIPGHPLMPPSIAENQTFTVLQKMWQWVAGWLPPPLVGWLNWMVGGVFAAVLAPIGQVLGQFLALFTQGWRGILLGSLGGLVLGFAVWLVWQGWQRWLDWRRLQQLEPMARLYARSVTWLTTQGHPKQATQTPGEYLAILRSRGLHQDVTQAFEQITNGYVDWRYGAKSVDMALLQQQFQQFRQFQQFSRRGKRG